MKRLLGIAGGLIALALPALAQSPSVAAAERLNTIAYARPQDRDHDRDHDRDDRDRDRDDRDRDRDDRNRERNWNAERDREWHRQHDRDHDKNWDRQRDEAYHRNTHYRNVLAPEWQRKYDSYYQRWLNYRATNNQSEMRSMERRMNSIRTNYGIPPNVPYGEIASDGGR
jgi:hypothetical protein